MTNASIHESNGQAARSGLNGATAAHGDNGTAVAPPVNGPAPSATADNGVPPAAGRDAGGRFTAGNKAGRGNPFYRHLCQTRQAVLAAVSEEELRRQVTVVPDREVFQEGYWEAFNRRRQQPQG